MGETCSNLSFASDFMVAKEMMGGVEVGGSPNPNPVMGAESFDRDNFDLDRPFPQPVRVNDGMNGVEVYVVAEPGQGRK